jgi:ethanolaminephosphotransferase
MLNFTLEDPPIWIWDIAFLASFSYQNLDNMDGRQARRTGSSSPLGLLFDHGIDALNVIICSILFSSALNCGTSWETYVFYYTPCTVFYFNTWEEYYTGKLVLPEINGPSDGQFLIQLTYLCNSCFGVYWWKDFSPFFDLRYQSIYALITLIACIFTLFTHIYQVVSESIYHRLKEDGFFIALTKLIPYILLNSLFLAWVSYSPTNIFYIQPRLCIWTIGLLNMKLTVHLMLDHISDEEHHPWRKTLIPFYFVGFHTIVIGFYKELTLLKELALISFLSWLHLTYNLFTEVSQALGIYIFTIDYDKSKCSNNDFQKKKNL